MSQPIFDDIDTLHLLLPRLLRRHLKPFREPDQLLNEQLYTAGLAVHESCTIETVQQAIEQWAGRDEGGFDVAWLPVHEGKMVGTICYMEIPLLRLEISITAEEGGKIFRLTHTVLKKT